MPSITSVPVTVVLDLAKLGIRSATFSQAAGPINMKLTQLTIRGNLRVGQVVGGGSSPPATASSGPVMPSISVARHPVDRLQCGLTATDCYHVEDNRWGAGQIAEGSGTSQYAQAAGRALSVGALGEVAFRTTWNWPQFVNGVDVESGGFVEVKGYPAIIYGRKPGSLGTSQWPAFSWTVRLPDGATVTAAPAGTPANIASDWQPLGGSVSTRAPSGDTPGTDLPRQLPLSAGTCLTTGVFSVSAIGKGHLAFDIWLQDPVQPNQTHGFTQAPITHEIMIPLRNWGNYGAYGHRNPAWLDHDVSIDGVLYHVYITKDLTTDDVSGSQSSGTVTGFRYNFGGLDGGYTNEETGVARIGWKFIIFQHEGSAHPLQADGTFRIDVAKFFTHLAGRTDSRGIGLIRNTEYLVSTELGVEMVYGQGDLTVWDYRVQAPAS